MDRTHRDDPREYGASRGGSTWTLGPVLTKKALLLLVCAAVALALLALAESHGLMSSRELALAMLGLTTASGVWWILVIRKSMKRDDLTLEHRLPAIRFAKVAIVALLMLLIYGLLYGGPWLPRLIGATVNLIWTGVLIWLVARLRKGTR